MGTIADLAPLHSKTECSRAIGWLGKDSEFPKGPVDRAFFDRLQELCGTDSALPEPVATGLHRCELCQFDGAGGHGQIYVPWEDQLLVAPKLCPHYIAVHWYRPPDVFQDAVMACPDPGSSEYRKLFLGAGGHELMQLWTS